MPAGACATVEWQSWRPATGRPSARRAPRRDHQRGRARHVCGAKAKPPEAAPAPEALKKERPGRIAATGPKGRTPEGITASSASACREMADTEFRGAAVAAPKSSALGRALAARALRGLPLAVLRLGRLAALALRLCGLALLGALLPSLTFLPRAGRIGRRGEDGRRRKGEGEKRKTKQLDHAAGPDPGVGAQGEFRMNRLSGAPGGTRHSEVHNARPALSGAWGRAEIALIRQSDGEILRVGGAQSARGCAFRQVSSRPAASTLV